MSEKWIVQAWNGRTWRKVRGIAGGPWLKASRADRIATTLYDDTGRAHRVKRVKA